MPQRLKDTKEDLILGAGGAYAEVGVVFCAALREIAYFASSSYNFSPQFIYLTSNE